jgi:hypothetical protein
MELRNRRRVNLWRVLRNPDDAVPAAERAARERYVEVVQVVVPGFARPLLSAISDAVDVGRSRAIPYSNHGVERETRLELATLDLAR